MDPAGLLALTPLRTLGSEFCYAAQPAAVLGLKVGRLGCEPSSNNEISSMRQGSLNAFTEPTNQLTPCSGRAALDAHGAGHKD